MSRVLQLIKTIASLLFYFGIIVGSANAAVNRQLIYSFNSEYNSDKDNRNFSNLQFGIDDDFYSSSFEGAYDLQSNFFVDHENSDSNDQHRGRFSGQYYFLKPSAWWNMDGLVEVLPNETDGDTDDFNSQTMTRLSTGPEISISRGFPGSVNMSTQVTKVDYSETGLDSKEYDASVIYSYPLSNNIVTGIDVSYRSRDYDDRENEDNDFDVASVGIFYTSSSRSILFSASANLGKTKTNGNTNKQNSYELDVIYLINSLSSLSISLSETLQTSDEFDLLPGNEDTALFEAGLFRNRRLAIGYQYSFGNLSASTEIFTNQIDALDSSLEEDDEINGGSINIAYRISENVQASASFRRTDTQSTGVEDDEIDLLVSYTKVHTRSLSSEFIAFYERDSSYQNDDFDGDELDNPGLLYRLIAILF